MNEGGRNLSFTQMGHFSKTLDIFERAGIFSRVKKWAIQDLNL